MWSYSWDAGRQWEDQHPDTTAPVKPHPGFLLGLCSSLSVWVFVNICDRSTIKEASVSPTGHEFRLERRRLRGLELSGMSCQRSEGLCLSQSLSLFCFCCMNEDR